MSLKLQTLMQEYIDDFLEKKSLAYVVKPAIPIVWFGNIERYKRSQKKVVTVALNPSLKEFGRGRFEMVPLNAGNAIPRLESTLNAYFETNPYGWFNHFENALSALGSSYYAQRAPNAALHIDIYSAIATNPTWGKLAANQKSATERKDLFKRLLALLNPDVILFSAGRDVFDEVFVSELQFEYVCGNDKVEGKKGFYIKKYRNGDQVLISGRNYRGTPFGGIAAKTVADIISGMMSS